MPVVRGRGGRAVVGYQTAARLRSWRREGDVVTFEVDQCEPFWGDQPITGLEVPIGRHLYAWPVVSGALATGEVIVTAEATCLGDR